MISLEWKNLFEWQMGRGEYITLSAITAIKTGADSRGMKVYDKDILFPVR